MSISRFTYLALLVSACGGTVDLIPAQDAAQPDAASLDFGATAPLDSGTTPNPSDGGSRDGGSGVDMGTPPRAGATRYLEGPLLQPVTQSVVDSMQQIRTVANGPDDTVFMKVGASGTVNNSNLKCFGAGGSYRVELEGNDGFRPTIDYFNGTTFGGAGPWDRTTLAAEVGRTARWAQEGAPSPIAQEIAALNPRFALVNYGTNDMQQGLTHGTALWPFYGYMSSLLAELTSAGIIPIITGLNPRSDSGTAALWVPTYDAVTRAIAESLQLPYLDLYLAANELPDRGLIGDGIHGNAYVDGSTQPCVFTAAGLQFNYNVRNLLTLKLLHEVRRTVIAGEPATGQNPRLWNGSGTAAAPFEVDVLPFSHHADTSTSASSTRDSYPACDSGQNESGPEYHYRLDLAEATPLRVMVFDADGVDIDVHVLDGQACVARDDKMVEGTFGPGRITIVTDTFVSQVNGAQAGRYTTVIVRCEPGDPDCN